ncbi:hypothetical protein SASPL_150558 [Salvia splendens]|uniref:glutaredoxin-dependent peroxiredoxin n=1 Tax=Salvia splendens TaxID=180675 RepID=A0A8X8Z2S3_SALSN|nr:hypothetical protein SASPL_150558 [Salvia splendens]
MGRIMLRMMHRLPLRYALSLAPNLSARHQYPNYLRERIAFSNSATKHLPRFVEKAAEFKAKGVDTIACVFVNDAFVMKAWKADLKIGEEVLLLSDGKIGCELDLSDKPIGLSVRPRRYAMFVEDGVVKVSFMTVGIIQGKDKVNCCPAAKADKIPLNNSCCYNERENMPSSFRAFN